MRLATPIAEALRRGATIVAASPRAARALQLAFAETQQAAGHTVWPTPPIHDWNAWLRDLFRDRAFTALDAPLLLTPLQERALWVRIQREDAAQVISPHSVAALAAEAWSLLSAYDAHAARRSSWVQPDAERFRHWAAEFERSCTRHAWLSASQLESFLAPRLEGLTLPPEILLVGFDRLTPARRALLSALTDRGVETSEFRHELEEPKAATRSWIAAVDRREEVTACAAWVRQQLLENPVTRIGVLVSGLAEARGSIDRIFRRILMPASEDIRRPSPPLPFEFSLGEPLAGIPAIRAALLLLRWLAAPLPESSISWLVLSGFVTGTGTDALTLARHDARQRRAGFLSPERSLPSYRAALAKSLDLRPFYDQLSALLRAVAAHHLPTATQLPSAFADLVPTLLETIAWPGPRTPDSVQFQALQRWQRLLDEIAQLDFDGTRLTWLEFIALLEQQADETIFAPESHDAPVQIMGPFESSGQQFDALWFLGTNDATWPLRGRLHPLLPPSVQRQYGMPHHSPEDDSRLAQDVTARLLASAPHVVFSYAQRDKDAEFRPSPLIAALFPAGARPELAQRPLALPPIASLEAIDDGDPLPWPSAQNAGGADVLRRQAACPFQAFAAKRLAAASLDTTQWGLNPAAKGKLLHVVLQRLFTAAEPAPLRTRDDLVAAIATNRLPSILEAHIDAALGALSGADFDDPWQRAWLAAEKRRLQARLSEWLTLEAQRQPFTVEACEQKLDNVHVGELRLSLRADRVDLLPDGSRFILDYKTGKLPTAPWKGERPDEPQLPLYAAYGNLENVSGVLFAKIRAGESGFEGRVRDAQTQLLDTLGNHKALVSDPYTDAMRDEWAATLLHLAEEFLRGEASVSPREPETCTWCPLPALCRKAELNLVTVGGDDPEDDEPDV